MKVFPALFRPMFAPLCALIAIFVSGCATTGIRGEKTSHPAATPVPPQTRAEQTEPPVAERPNRAPPLRPAPETPAPTVAPVPAKPETTPAVASQSPAPKVEHARVVGTQESSILFDNFTAFITAIDGRKIPMGRDGWNVPLEIETGHRTLNVEFNRGVFYARGRLEFDAVANANYELKFATDAELFGHNSYCNFWVIDTATGKTVSLISKDSVEKIATAAAR
jgi:hypothetical protein